MLTINDCGLVAKPADAADLKPAEETLGGSSPSGPTIYYDAMFPTRQSWEETLPPSELPLAAGQKRICFQDGIGFFDCEIVSFTDTEVTVKNENGVVFSETYDILGILVDGIEHKRLLAEEAQDAESSN